MRVSIPGPMGKYKDEDYNRASFAFAWNHLTVAGITAISPHFLESAIEIDARAKMSIEAVYRYAIPIDIFALSSCDYAIALPGWEGSKGCVCEKVNADIMGIPWIAPDTVLVGGPSGIGNGLDEYLEQCVEELKERAFENSCRA